jgi:hypothetical protein
LRYGSRKSSDKKGKVGKSISPGKNRCNSPGKIALCGTGTGSATVQRIGEANGGIEGVLSAFTIVMKEKEEGRE